MSARHAMAASATLHAVRGALATLGEPSGGRGAPTKRRRADALDRVRRALRQSVVRAALTHFTARERACGARAPPPPPDADPDRTPCPLSWTELVAELVFCTARAAEDAARAARPVASALALAADSMALLRAAVSRAMEHAGFAALEDVVLGFVIHAATWLSDAKRAPLMDDAWRCLQELLEADGLRARLPRAYICFWVNACFQQLSESGPMFRRSSPATNAARRVFVLLAKEASPSDALRRKSPVPLEASNGSSTVRAKGALHGETRRRRPGNDFVPVYALILHRACALLDVAKNRPLGVQRELESAALAVLAACISDHCLELFMSRAAHQILLRGAPAAAACWTERRHRPHALAFARSLVRVVPCEAGSSGGIDLLRERVRAELSALSLTVGRVTASAQNEIEEDFIQVASFLISTEEVLRFLESLGPSQPSFGAVSTATAYLRLLHAQLVRKSDEVIASCPRAVRVVVSLFSSIGGDTCVLPCHCAVWACNVLSVGLSSASVLSGSVDFRLLDDGIVRGRSSPAACEYSEATASHELRGAGKFGSNSTSSMPQGHSGVTSLRAKETESEVSLSQSSLLATALWRDAYNCLARQLLRGRAILRRRPGRGADLVLGSREYTVSMMETSALTVMTDVLSCGMVSAGDALFVRTNDFNGDAESFWSLSLFDFDCFQPDLSLAALSFARAHAATFGLPTQCGLSQRLRLVSSLVHTFVDRARASDTNVPVGAATLAGGTAVGISSGCCFSSPVLERRLSLGSPKWGDLSSGRRVCGGAEDVLDAFSSLFARSEKISGEMTVAKSFFFRESRSELERIVFPSGGGWTDAFFADLGDGSELLNNLNARESSRQRPTLEGKSTRLLLEHRLVASVLKVLCVAEGDTRSPSNNALVVGADDMRTLSNAPGKVPEPRVSTRSGIPSASVGRMRKGFTKEASKPGITSSSLSGDDAESSVLNSRLSCFDVRSLLSSLGVEIDDSGAVLKVGVLKSENASVTNIHVLAFLTSYVTEKLELGFWDFSETGTSADLQRTVLQLIRVCFMRLSSSLEVFLDSDEALALLPHALLSSLRIANGFSCTVGCGSGGPRSESDLHELRLFISTIFKDSLLPALLERLRFLLTSSMEKAVDQVKRAISPVVLEYSGSRASGLQKRSLSSIDDHFASRPAKRMRSGHGVGDSDLWTAGDSNCAKDDDCAEFSENHVYQRVSPREPVNDSSSDRSDAGNWDSPPRDSIGKPEPDVGSQGPGGFVALGVSTVAESVNLICAGIKALLSASHGVADEIVDRISEHLDTCAAVSQKLSPDAHEQDMVASREICNDFLEVREGVWDVLFSARSVKGAEIAAKDILGVGRKLKGLCALRRKLTESYEDEFSFEKCTLISCACLEEMSVSLLSFCNRYLESCLCVGTTTGRRGTPSESQKKLVHGVLEFVDSIDSRSSRLSRKAKVMLLKTQCTAIEVVMRPGMAGKSLALLFPSEVVSVCQNIRGKLLACIDDSDPQIRLATGGILPVLMRCQISPLDSEGDNFLDVAFEKILASCERDDLSRFNRGPFDSTLSRSQTGAMEARNSDNSSHSERDSLELCPFLSSFTAVDEFCRKMTAVSSVTELGVVSASKRSKVVFQLCMWGRNCRDSEIVAFGGLVRLSCRLGYASPGCLFDAHRRSILTMWVDLTRRLGVQLRTFPVRLVLGKDRFRDGGNFDWLMDNAEELIPLLIAADSANSLKQTEELAEDLDMTLASLLDAYPACVYRTFPMLFSAAKNAKGGKLWDRLWVTAPQRGQENTLKWAARHKHMEVLCNIILSVAPGESCRRPQYLRVGGDDAALGFSRDCSGARPPTYDPLVCLVAINNLAFGVQGIVTAIPVLDTDVLRGSIFSNDSEVGELNLDGVSLYMKKRPLILAKALGFIYQNLMGPPGPPSTEVLQSSFMALGMLYRVSKQTLLCDTYLRLALCDLILAGFHYPETAENALWLMQEVSESFTNMRDGQVSLMRESIWLGLLRSNGTCALENILDCGSRRANRWSEVLELFVPSLVSIGCTSGDSFLIKFARQAVSEMVEAAVAQGAENAVGLLDTFPEGKAFKAERAAQESCFLHLIEERALSDERVVEYRMWRFNCYRSHSRRDCPGLLSRLRGLREVFENRFELLRAMLESGPIDLDDSSSSLGRRLAGITVSYLLSIFRDDESHTATHRRFDRHHLLRGTFSERNLGRSKHRTNQHLSILVKDEAIRCLSVLGSILPALDTGSHFIASGFQGNDAKDSVSTATEALCHELRSDCAVTRRVAVETLPRLLRTRDGGEVLKEKASSFRDELKIFAFASKQKQMASISRLDPISGFEAAQSLPDIRTRKAWCLQSYESAFGGDVVSTWLRTLAASLASLCDNPALSILESVCFASKSFACTLFPTLFSEVVARHRDDAVLIGSLSTNLRYEILDRRDVPMECLRLVVRCLDRMCEIGLRSIREDGVPESRFVPDRRHQGSNVSRRLYVLDIPYLCVAKVANRAGSFFSALRFSALHIDVEAVDCERVMRISTTAWTDACIESVKEQVRIARLGVSSVVSHALNGIGENDGQRVVSQSDGILERSAVLSTVESNWTRMLGACDALTVLGREPYNGGPSCLTFSPGSQEGTVPMFARHRSIFRALLGIGATRTAVRSWNEVVSSASRLLEDTSGLAGPALSESELRAAKDLIELRYHAAWRLSEWDDPRVEPLQRLVCVSESASLQSSSGLGLHEALHGSLKAISSGDISSALTCVSNARVEITKRLAKTFEASTGILGNVRAAAESLLLLEDVSQAALVHGRTLVNVIRDGSAVPVRSSLPRSETKHEGLEPFFAGGHLDVLRFRSGEGSSKADPLKGVKVDASRKDIDLVAGSWSELVDSWKHGRCRLGSHVDGKGRSTFHSDESETTLLLRLVLAKTMGVKHCIAGLSSSLASSILRNGSDKGSWARAASALGSFESSHAKDAVSIEDKASWLLTHARLCWTAGEDGVSKQSALQAVKRVIENDLGGSLTHLSGNVAGKRRTLRFDCRWDNIDSCRESYALSLLRSEACRLAASWSTSLHDEEPISLFYGYLELGLSAFPDTGASRGRCASHYYMAEYATSQLVSIDVYRKTKEYLFRSRNVEKMSARIQKIESKLSTGRSRADQKKSMERYLIELRKNLTREHERLSGINSLYEEWQLLAARHYAACLRMGDEHDLRAAFRLVSLWIEGAEKFPAMNTILVAEESPDTQEQNVVNVPVNKLLPLAPQIASRLGKPNSGRFERALSILLTKMTSSHLSHCLWLLVALSNLTRPIPVNLMRKKTGLYIGDEDKKMAADNIIAAVRVKDPVAVSQTLLLAQYYIAVSEIPKERRRSFPQRGLPVIDELNEVIVPSASLPLFGLSSNSHSLPYVLGFEKRAKVLNGLSTPMLIQCRGSDGVLYSQIVKYEDDMRQDAVMEQLFTVLNELLRSNSEAAVRSLRVRTYRVVPLSPFAGVMQFVSNTEALREYLVGSSDTGFKFSAHGRHRPHDLSQSQILNRYRRLPRFEKAPQVKLMREIWPQFQPVFRHFFLENFSDPAQWHSRQLTYTRSTAVMSIVGWMVGLGDRHLSNILVDQKTAELVHIDFGVAFETGKLLPTPELMPFRLTRDVVDGMGIDGVEGVFRTSCEVTMKLLRENKDLILMVVEVLLHDPLCNWALEPMSAIQAGPRGSATCEEDDIENVVDDDDDSVFEMPGEAGDRRVARHLGRTERDLNDEAQQVLSVISEKLEGLEGTDRLSVEAHVARLIDTARSVDVIACAFIGWACYV